MSHPSEWVAPASKPDGRRMIMPDPVTARRIGLTNVLFASLLIVMCNMYVGGVVLVSPWSLRISQKIAKPMMNKIGEGMQAQIDAISKKEAAETNASVKASYAQSRKNLERSIASTRLPMNMGMESLQDRRMRIYMLSDVVLLTGLNIAMLLSGVGLLQLKAWGRKTAIVVACVKLVRIAAVTAVSFVWYIPYEVERSAKQMAAANVGPNPAAPALSPQLLSAFYYAITAVSAIVAMGYSLLILFFLMKRSVRAACVNTSADDGNNLS